MGGITKTVWNQIPMHRNPNISFMSQAEEADSTHYQSVVGILRYVLHTRPDLSFSVDYVNGFMERPTKENMSVVKQILRYVNGATNLGCTDMKITRES